ncbi:GTP cyclohydrolase II [Salmonella enterica subsp. enterica serovar Infantis]|nr:GTP cyclohydrolase II [Salmonella enterica subsp. enterica serovar Infantis]EGI5923928.1 GTP cyclohydrolase II [Salmonella enterica subsp. enterica serovar Colindale]
MNNTKIRNHVHIPIDMAKNKTEFYSFTNLSKEHIAIVIGSIDITKPVMIRIHSECLTGDVFGSHRCDCGSQLNDAIRKIDEHGCGIIIYMRQEGRGIGLYSKIDAYELQIKGVDTFSANKILGFDDDLRTYDEAVAMLKSLGVTKVEIITNNPDKILCLEENGINVTKVIPTGTFTTKENINYLRSKVEKKHHTLNIQ